MTRIEEIPYMTAEVYSPEYGGKSFPIPDMMGEIADMRNIEDSFDYVVSHLECADQREHIRPHKAAYCKRLKKLLSSGQFRVTEKDIRTLEVKDGPKARIVQCPTVFHRVGCHAVMVPFERHTYPTLINNTAASIKGRGMHWLHQIIEEDLVADPEGMKMYYQSDIYHYYDCISQEIMMRQVREYTIDPLVLPIVDNFITLLKQGLSKGLRSSQCLANLHLNGVDHKMCKVVKYHLIDDPTVEGGKGVAVSGEGELKINGKRIRYHYYRYCDDIVIFASTAKELWILRNYLAGLLSELGLTIKPSEAVRPITEGLDYLGFDTFKPTLTKTKNCGEVLLPYSRIRKRTKKKFARKMSEVKSRKRRQVLIGSFFGMAAHADCRHLLKTLLTTAEYKKLKHKRKMRDFGDFKISPMTLNGKKNFKGTKISPRDLHGHGFIVNDFERGLVAKRDQEDYMRRLQDAALRNVPAELVSSPKEKYLLQVIYHPKLEEIWRDHSVNIGDEKEKAENRKRSLARLKSMLDDLTLRGELPKLLNKMWTGDREIWHTIDDLDKSGEIPFFVSVEMDFTGQYPKANLVSATRFGMRSPTPEETDLLLSTLNLK